MPVFNVRSPDGQLFRVTAPEGATEEEIIQYAQTQMSQMGQLNAPQPKEGIGAALTGGFKRFLSTSETAGESLINAELAAQRGLERSQRIGEQYAPGASLEKVKQAYAERGLFPAVGEAISQIPSALAEQAPQIAATLGAARLGAMAGAPLGPVGALVGGIGGAVVPSLVQLYGSNIERQAQEGAKEISRAGALAAAAPGAALEVASTFIPLGRTLVGKLLGPNAEKALARGSNEAIERQAQEALTTSLLKGTAVGAAVEIPTEVTQQMLERFQAGLPLTTEDALKEYGEAAYGAGLVGGPFGAAARGLGRSGVRAEAERIQQEEAARLAVPEEELEQRFPDVLPGGFKIEREELGREMGPQGYSIMAEGREEPLSVVDTQEEADAKLASLTKIRAEERDNLLKQEEKINADVQKARDRLERLEATEQTDTEEYQTLKAEFPAMLDESAQKIKETYDKVEALSKPLTVMPFGEVERVNEQFKLIGPDSQEVGVFKTREQAEGVVEQAVGEDTFKQTRANREAAKQLYKTFVPQMRKFGLGDVGLDIVEKIENGAGGAYLNKLIKVSLEDANPLQTMRHESIHALKDLGFFTPQQWNVLSDRAKKTWIEDMKKTPYEGDKTRHDAYVELFTQEGKDKGLDGQALDQYVNESLIEEAVADAFGAYDKGAKPPPGMIAALVRKLKNFFEKLSQALRGSGFTSAEDIFQTIERGGLKPAAKAEPAAEEKLSLRVAKKVGKQLGLNDEEIASTSISLQTGKAGVDQFKKQPIGGLPSVVQFLEDRRAQSGLKPLDINNEQDREELAKLLAAEAMAAINAGGGALQWYDSVIDSMMRVASLKYPELATSEDSKAALRMAIAIASQGLNVEDNLTFATSQYDYFRQNGKFNEIGSGADGAAMKSNFTLANQMIDQYGLPTLRKFLQTEFTVQELRSAGFEIGGELEDEKVTGSAIFGPKIGFGFYSNLSGNFEPVTMDMWFMRTIGRLTGKLKGFDEKKFGEQLDRFRKSFSERGEDGLYADEFKDEELQKAMESPEGAVELSRVVNSVFNSDFKNNRELYDEGARKKTNLVYAAQNLIKSADAPKDAPQNGTERRLLRDVVARTVDKVAKAYGQRIPPASLQALIWYPEQELYKALGVRLRVTSQDYAGAIKKLLMKEGYSESTIDRAAKSGPGAVQPVAGEQVQAGVAATGEKPKATFEPVEREEFLEKRREEQVLKQEREAPRRKKVIFEVAPDPNNVALTNAWRELPQNERLRISNDIAKKIIASAKQDLGFEGRVFPQVGSYLDDTNPSFALFLEKGNPVEISKFLGHALSQDSMMVVSPRPGPGLEKVGAVVVDVKTQSPSEIDAIYQRLRNIRVNGDQIVGGQTTMNNKMIILNYSNVRDQEFLQLVDQQLNGEYDVEYTDVYSAFPEKKDYNYDNPQDDPRGKAKVVRERARALRAEATAILQQEIGTKAEAPAGKEKLSLKAPTGPNFKRWFGDSEVVNKDGTPKIMYHGTARDITEFRPKQASAIFVTDDPDTAASYSQESAQWMADHADEFLTPAQKQEVLKRTKKLLRGNGYNAAQISALEADQGILKTDEFREAVEPYMPSGPNVMPLYVRAEKIFDFDNPKHVQSVVEKIPDLNPDDFQRTNNWTTVENPKVQAAIKAMGFDSFYVNEHGIKNLAVYEPNQVKSATGNDETFSRTSPDVRYSLRGVAFPSVKEAQKAADDTPVPNTEEFKQYIAGSQWLDEEGKAKKFFHATTSNFFEFKDGVIYLSETAADSEKFGRADEDRLRANIYRALNKDEKLPLFQRAVDKAVEAGKISAERGQTFMRDAKRKIPDFGKYTAIKEEMDAELIALAPERMKIMPLYARAMTPFDFRNPDHVDQVVSYIRQNFEYYRNPSERVKQEARERGFPTAYPDKWFDGLPGLLVQGYETTIEQPPVQNALRRLGFDGYVTRKNRTAPLNYAIYKPQQVKSITGNLGDYGFESKDIRYSLRKFDKNDLPQDSRGYMLPENTLIFHGAYKERADKIEETGGVLLSRPPMRVSGGATNEGGLIFFGGEETARRYANSEADPMAARAARESGVERLPGKVFETVTDRPYKLINRSHKISKEEAELLTKALGLPDYKALRAGDSLEIAATRAADYDNSNIDRYEVTKRTGKGKETISAPWPTIFRALGVDGFFDGFSVALTANNGIRLIGDDGRLVKFSLPSLPSLSAAANDRIREVAPGRIELGFKARVVGAFKPDYTALRQMFLNRYETIAVYDRELRKKIKEAGGPELLADQSAEFAALQSDLSAGVAASAIGVGDRQGGVPVYRNGVTTIDTSVKGLAEALAPLAQQGKPKAGEPDIYAQYQFWAGWKRARRLLREGREEVYTAADAQIAQEIEDAHPEFIQVQKDLIAFNNGIVNYGVQTGVLSRERARVYTQYADYIPFYRQLELDRTIGPNPFSGISGVKGPKALKGGDAPLGDFLENMVRNTQSMINAGMKNVAAQRATKVALEINQVERLPRPAKGLGIDVYTVLEKGELVYYRANDKLFIDALASLNMPDLPFLGILSAPANVLRNLVTKDPGFMMANLLRDSLSSYVTSGQNVTPVVGTMVNFGKALAGKDKNLQALFNAGVIGGYEFSQNIQQSGETLSADLNKKAGKDPILLRPFKSLWEGLEKGTTASDAATRMAIYDRVMKETGNEAEAISRALEVMNFNRKGNNVLIRVATAALPFFNARLQGLDVFYRAARGRMNTNDAAEIKKRFWIRGATMMALSVMYYLSVAGDEEYERQEEETKDNNWIFPALGIRIPTPFEVGTLFKTVPERITAYLMGNDTGKDLGASTLRALANTFAFNPIPQTFKPIIEVATNYNFFTMRPIVGQGMQDVAPQFQVGPGTSKTAETIGGLINVSPMKLDQLIKGYTGTIGGYLVDVVDAIASEFSDVPKASKRFEQLPVVKRFALDPEARGSVTQFYELQKSVDTFVRTANLLEKTARPEEYLEYFQDNVDLLAAKDYVSGIEKEMKKLRDMRRIINSSDMPSDEKRDMLTDLGRLEISLTANIKATKRMFSELK